MKRTIKRYSRRLNQRKWQTLVEIGVAYANQKDRFLLEYGRPTVFGRYRGHRQARDELVAAGYRSPFGLQGRYWKQALNLARISY